MKKIIARLATDSASFRNHMRHIPIDPLTTTNLMARHRPLINDYFQNDSKEEIAHCIKAELVIILTALRKPDMPECITAYNTLKNIIAESKAKNYTEVIQFSKENPSVKGLKTFISKQCNAPESKAFLALFNRVFE